MLVVPQTYSEWSAVLEVLKSRQNDSEVLEVMQKGTIVWQSGVAERFSKKLIDTVNYRMNYASDKFQKDMAHANGNDGAIIQALLSLRKEMMFLTKVLNIRALPDKDREYYLNLIIDQANTMQNSLEDSAKKDRSGKLSSIIRNHKVNVW